MSPSKRDDAETFRRQAAENLQDLGMRFRAVVQSAHDAIVLVGTRGEIHLWNTAAERMFGWTDAEARRRVFLSLFAEESRAEIERRVHRCLEVGADAPAGTMETIALDCSGREFPVEAAFSGFASGRGRFASAILRDVRERKLAEERLRTALARARESDRLKSAFLDNVSHEIRTPINVIVGNAEILAEHLRELGDSTQAAGVAAMQRAGKRLVDAVGRVLDYARISSGELAPRRTRVRLSEIVEAEIENLAPLAAEKGIELAVEIEVPRLAVFADRPCLASAVMNLVDNAIKFTVEGGVRVRVAREAKGGSVVEVHDTGVGIEPWFRERLFEPFSQEEMGDRRAYEGHGLGLAVARRYVELAGGTIEVESEKGKGSTFRIRLPAAARPRPGPDAETIVVENEGVRLPWIERLAGEPHVRIVAGVEAARDWLEDERSRKTTAGIVIALGLGERAFGLCREIREDPWWWDLPILGVAEEGEEWSRGRGLAAGIDQVLASGAAPTDFAAALRRAGGTD